MGRGRIDRGPCRPGRGGRLHRRCRPPQRRLRPGRPAARALNARSATCGGALATDRELLTADGRIAERVLDRIRHRALDVDEREVVEELDRTDHGPGNASFVGDRPDEIARSQPGSSTPTDPELLPTVRFRAARDPIAGAAAVGRSAGTTGAASSGGSARTARRAEPATVGATTRECRHTAPPRTAGSARPASLAWTGLLQ